MGSKGRRWAWLGAGVLIVSAGFAADRAVRASLERRAREVDLVAAVRGIGLEGRIAVPTWEGSRLRWLPRAALRLRGVEAQVLSGRPGPGSASGRIRFDAVDLVPRWGFPLRGGLERVEIRGGTVEIGRDLLPPVPRTYIDPIAGTERPIPWGALLRVIQEGGPGQSGSVSSRGGRRPRTSGQEPALLAHDLEIRLPAELLPAGESVTVGEARLFAGGDQLKLAGDLRVRAANRSWSVPVGIERHRGDSGRGSAWELSLGSDSSGVRLRLAGGGRGTALSWSGALRDPEGTVAQAFLDGRSGPLGRLRWEGPWSLEASGEGWQLSGVREATVRPQGGVLSLAGAGTPRTAVSGTVRILPGRIDISPLVLRDRAGARPDRIRPDRVRSDRVVSDSAEFRLAWLSTTGGLRLSGGLSGTIDPGWIGLLGERWSAAGRMNASVTFAGASDARGGGWSLVPRGRVDGALTRLSGPWFTDSLSQGSLEAWGAEERVGFVLAGAWGGSPFRLEARDLPLADPRRPDYPRAETRWAFTSASCRIEDFGLDPVRFPAAAGIPFWLALPGRGEVRLDRGSVSEVVFDSLSADVDRRGGGFRVDQLDVRLGGGRITGGSNAMTGRRSSAPAGETRLQIEGIDLVRLRPLLERFDPRLAAGVAGTLSATLRVRWPGPGDPISAGIPIEGSLRVSDGSLRGLPLQEELQRRTHLEGLSVLSFDLLQADIRRDDGTLRWNRLRLDAPPFRIEGAGRLGAGDSLRFVLSARPLGEAAGLGEIFSSLVGGESPMLYAMISGPAKQPGVQVLSRSGFLRELDRLGGTLPAEVAEPRR
jgi:hypothetical protein